MTYLRIEGIDYPATFNGKVKDQNWDNRSSKTINTSSMNISTAMDYFHDDVEWAIVEKIVSLHERLDENEDPVLDENGNPVMEETVEEFVHDNSEYSLLGDITLHNNESISVTMGKLTDLEQAYEIMYGGE